MKKHNKIFKSPRASIDRKKKFHALITKNLENYSLRLISIKECISNAGALTTDMILYQNADNEISNSARDGIFIVSVNYYAMLYMQLFTGNFTVDRRHTYQQVISLMEDVLTDADKNGVLWTEDFPEAINSSREFSRQMVDFFYRAGTDGCQKYLTASIYSILLPGNGYSAINRRQIENEIQALNAEKFLNDRSGIIKAGM